MGFGFVFTYLLIAAIVAPLVWLTWWAVASLGGPRRLREAPVRVAAGPRAEARPAAVDTKFQGRAGAVIIRRLSDGLEIGTCQGPDSSGKCPRVLPDTAVPCAAAILTLPRPLNGSLEWQVPAGYRTCMLGSYDAFRQAPATR
jgi:hypothetical protein